MSETVPGGDVSRRPSESGRSAARPATDPRTPKESTIRRLLVVSCCLALLGLALTLWGLYDPSAGVLMLSMSAGQMLGMLSMALFIVAVIADLRRKRVFSESDD